jgi:transposase
MSQKSSCAIAVIGIDIGKNSFHIVGHDQRGAIVLWQKWSRGQVEARLANLPRCLIGMEACVGAHHLSRKLALTALCIHNYIYASGPREAANLSMGSAPMSNAKPRTAGRHFLQIPGPTPVPDRILRAMDRPVLDHRGPAFQELGQPGNIRRRSGGGGDYERCEDRLSAFSETGEKRAGLGRAL